MHKIIIENDKVIDADIKYSYKEKENLFGISEIDLFIDNDSNILMNIDMNESKLIINFHIKENINTNLIIIIKGIKSKIQYKYNLDYNSKLNIQKINIVDSIREMIVANLAEDSDFNYIFKGIAKSQENYDYMIYHNGINSNSNVINNCINETGSIYMQISSFIPKDICGCYANQYNRIINNTNNKCEIRPNLYIDCCDVVANHSALIDKFNNNELFYLKTKGIDHNDAVKLLTQGFLLSGITSEEIIDIINKRYGGE